MDLSAEQQDSLSELVNIAFGRAAASLSTLTGHRVLLDVPNVVVCPINELASVLNGRIVDEVATIHQIFSGPVAGDAMLVLDYDGALTLCSLLVDDRPDTTFLNATDREVLTEIGNILLSACLSMFGSLLEVHISFSVPRLHVDELDDMLSSVTINSQELRYALVISANFRLRDSSVGGYMVIVLGVASLDRLLQGLQTAI